MESEFRKAMRALERRNRELEEELARAHCETITVRNQWFAVYEDLEKEYSGKLQTAEKENVCMEQRALKAERRLDDALNKIAEQRQRIYGLETELEEEKI